MDKYVIVSTRHMKDGILEFWGKEECGYYNDIELAGKYEKDNLPRDFKFYGEVDNIMALEDFYIKISELAEICHKKTIYKIL